MRKLIFFVTLMFLVLLACKKTNTTEFQKPEISQHSSISIEEAKQRLRTIYKYNENDPIATTSSSAIKFLSKQIAPIWQEKINSVVNLEQILEVPLSFGTKNGYSLDTSSRTKRSTNEIQTLSYLVFTKKPGAEIQVAIMTIIADQEYL